MKRLPFEPPTDHYDQKIEQIDEKICKLIKQRKELSNNNPGFPHKHLISSWSAKYHFYEDFLNGVFSHFLNEELYKPFVEPKGFVKNIPILGSFEKGDVFYSVPFISQFENVSVVHLSIDKGQVSEEEMHRDHSFYKMSIVGETEYDCRNEGGGGSSGHMSYRYIVSPPLPEDRSKYKIVFTEIKGPFNKETDFEFAI
ncbi:hypothetical protein [Bacillus suaedaesalsae]|uniref:Uncharacterized protein n=1 Tax=Bacillus suaedaesalsae TaxID=2810349 RepID=A0ABS2DHT1_9BACI|nr:hypothetical protein [Bacillus suaedaesalsae]MBM6617999.1 hypothetical protein [Bacillus suaedaesalsae]